MPGAQNPNIPRLWDPLQLDETAPRLPRIGVEEVQPVYPIEPAYLGLSPLMYRATTSINGATINQTIAADLTQLAGSSEIDLNSLQMWYTMHIRIYGGTVTPIEMQTGMANPGAYIPFWQDELTNVGNVNVGAVLCPPGYDVQFNTYTNGGGGDNITINCLGFQAPPGSPLPNITFSISRMSP